jgi:hypothetical protein
MSYDRQIDQVCPHYVVQEALFPGSDRQTIYPIRPIATIASVKLRLDGLIQVPSYGVALPAQAVGGVNGPYTITTGVNDTLVVAVNQGSTPQQVVVPGGVGVTSNQLAYFLNLNLQGINFQAVGNGIKFLTTTEGPNTSVMFQTGSTLVKTLGFTLNREYRGQQLVPGWTVINDPTAIFRDSPNRLILFDGPLASGTEFVEIDYTTIRQLCRRCGGTGVEFDWRYDQSGNIITVKDDNLLVQELEKDFFTILGSNPFHIWYGTNLLDTIGSKLTANGFVQNVIMSDIYTAFNRWQQVKTQQQNNVGQYVSDKEFPYRLLSVQLQQSQQDPTVIFVNMTIQNRSTQPIQLSRGLKIAQPYDLLGANQQTGYIRQSLSNYVLVPGG